MFSKMVVATDLSDDSNKMIPALGGLKDLGVREAVLIHCFSVIDMGTLASGTLTEQLAEAARPELDRQQNVLIELGFKVETRLLFGRPDVEINNVADELDCPLVVVGSPCGSMAAEIFLGDVACAAVHNATRPTLIMRVDPEKQLMDHILFPTDFSDNAERAFSYLVELAGRGAKRVTLLHVQDHGRIDKHLKDRLDEFNKIDTARLERLSAQLREKGADEVSFELSYGAPKKDILARISEKNVSLVVMGSQGRGYLGDIFLGSVSHAVARHSKASVLLVPALK